jgi:hypothetical protein
MRRDSNIGAGGRSRHTGDEDEGGYADTNEVKGAPKHLSSLI